MTNISWAPAYAGVTRIIARDTRNARDQNRPSRLKIHLNPFLSGLIWIILNTLALAVSFLPRRLELILGKFLGSLYLHIDPRRRKIAYDNIRRCLPELGADGWDRLLKENYKHYGILALEILHMFSPIPGHYRRYARKVAVVEDFENWKRAHARGKGVLCISAHLGNWELMAALAAMNGMPITIATRHLKPEWLHKKIEAARDSVGVKAAYLPNTIPAILRTLRHKESMGFVLDQYAPPPMGIPAKFFGVKVDTLAAVAPLAKRYGAPIIPALQVRDAAGIVHIRFEPELDLGTDIEDEVRSTERLVAKVEEWIRANPSQWLWVHRRFKNVSWPVDAGATTRT